MGRVVARQACSACQERGADRQGNNLHIYDDGKGYCHACGHVEKNVEEKEEKKYTRRESVSSTDVSSVETISSIRALPERGISKEIAERYGVRASVDETSGKNSVHFYPYYRRGKLAAYKQRRLPKQFSWIGDTKDGKGLFGQQLYENLDRGKKFLVVCEGEIDTLSVAEILKRSGKDYAVVSIQDGAEASGAVKASLKANAEFLSSFEKVLLCFDNDPAGDVYVQAVADWLCTMTSVAIMSLKDTEYKDINEILMAEDYEVFWTAWKNCKVYQPESIVHVSDVDFEDIAQPVEAGYPFEWDCMNRVYKGLRKGELTVVTAGCVDRDTQYLSRGGWKAIGDYHGEEVAQYNEDGSISFVQPQAYIKAPCETLTRFRTKYGVDQILSDEHTVVYWNRDYPTMQKISFAEMRRKHESNTYGFTGGFKTTFSWSGSGIDMNEGELRLQVAVMADGRVVKEGKDNYTQMRFAKERKYLRLLEMCKKYGLRFDDRGINNQGSYEVIVWPKYKDKEFDEKYWNCTKEQLEIILDELLYWDGYMANEAFSTTSKNTADFVQFAYSATGRRASISVDKRSEKYKGGWAATVSPAGNSIVGITNKERKLKFEEYKTTDGFKYCFTVPSGMLVLRCNNRIFVTGNSGLGKSTIVREMVDGVVRNNPKVVVGVMSLEDSLSKAIRSYCALRLAVPLGRLTTNPDCVDKEEYRKVFDSFAKSGQYVFFDSSKFLDLDKLMNKVEYFARSAGCDYLIIDNLTLIAARSKETDERRAIDNVMASLAGLVASTGMGIILVNHLTRQKGVSPNNGDMVEIQHLRGSGAIEAFSDNIIAAERNQQSDNEADKNTVLLRALKNRAFGITGMIGKLQYIPETGRLVELKSDF